MKSPDPILKQVSWVVSLVAALFIYISLAAAPVLPTPSTQALSQNTNGQVIATNKITFIRGLAVTNEPTSPNDVARFVDLQGATQAVWTVSQYPEALLLDGSRAMTGDLDMGTHNITNATHIFADGDISAGGLITAGDFYVDQNWDSSQRTLYDNYTVPSINYGAHNLFGNWTVETNLVVGGVLTAGGVDASGQKVWNVAAGTTVGDVIVYEQLTNQSAANLTSDTIASARIPPTITGDRTIDGDVLITGSVTIGGTNFTLNSTNFFMLDRLFHVNQGTTTNQPAPVQIAGLAVHRGDVAGVERDHAVLVWDEINGQWAVGFSNDDATFVSNAVFKALTFVGSGEGLTSVPTAALNGVIATNNIPLDYVKTNITLTTGGGPLQGGGNLSANRSFSYNGSITHNESGGTNVNAGTLQGTLLYARLPTGSLTNLASNPSFLSFTNSSGAWMAYMTAIPIATATDNNMNSGTNWPFQVLTTNLVASKNIGYGSAIGATGQNYLWRLSKDTGELLQFVVDNTGKGISFYTQDYTNGSQGTRLSIGFSGSTGNVLPQIQAVQNGAGSFGSVGLNNSGGGLIFSALGYTVTNQGSLFQQGPAVFTNMLNAQIGYQFNGVPGSSFVETNSWGAVTNINSYAGGIITNHATLP